MKKQINKGKLGLQTSTIRRMSQPMSDDRLAEVAGGVSVSCLPLTKVQETHQCQ